MLIGWGMYNNFIESFTLSLVDSFLSSQKLKTNNAMLFVQSEVNITRDAWKINDVCNL